MLSSRFLIIASLTAGAYACGDGNTASNVAAPGAETTSRTQSLEAGAQLLQGTAPLREINTYLDGFHFYSDRIQEQMEAHHYCDVLNEDVTQCIIYDSNVADAKLMGIEYIVSEQLFTALPEAEKQLWHSHAYEVTSGQLIAPGVPQIAEHELMEKLVGTYGKTWHTWHTDQHLQLPLGGPQLMMGFTADGQADPALIAERNRRFGVDAENIRANRADISAPPVAAGADSWQNGPAFQLDDLAAAAPHVPAGIEPEPDVGRVPE